MNFLKRINESLNAQNSTIEYIENNLNRIRASRGAFKRSFIDDSNFAFNNPVQFIYSYLNIPTINHAIKQNPLIVRILEDNNLSLDYKIDNVKDIVASHLIPTARVAHKIYCNYEKEIDKEAYNCLVQASLLHVIGKVFIPSEILNKNGKLTFKERHIVELHNRLSYEILITTNLPKQVARLAWEHHDYDNCFKRTVLNQILMIADIYCALREVRPYKKALNDITAKTILYDMGLNGKFDAGYIKYLFT